MLLSMLLLMFIIWTLGLILHNEDNSSIFIKFRSIKTHLISVTQRRNHPFIYPGIQIKWKIMDILSFTPVHLLHILHSTGCRSAEGMGKVQYFYIYLPYFNFNEDCGLYKAISLDLT